jgi:hypothetical protein
MKTIAVISLFLGVIMAVKLTSNCYLLLPATGSDAKIDDKVGAFILTAIAVFFIVFFISIQLTDAVESDINSRLIKDGSGFSEIAQKGLRSTFIGLSFLAVSSFLSMVFAHLVRFLFPFLNAEKVNFAKGRLHLLTGGYSILVEVITLVASILGIISFYLTHIS